MKVQMWVCDKCGVRYKEDSEIALRISVYAPKALEMLDLCKHCKKSFEQWLAVMKS